MLGDYLTTALACLLWVSLALVLYAYVGYPLLVCLAARFCGRPIAPPQVPERELPTVTLLVSALNEEKWIASRIENALAMDYPPDRLRLVVASDGSTDCTAQIVRSFADKHPGRVYLHEFRQRSGKAIVLNTIVPEMASEIAVLSDANTFFHPSAVRNLVRWFQADGVVAVCGKLELTDPATGRNVDGLYWRYENFLKHCEARLGGLLGANGAVYAIRPSDYVPIPGDTIIDDFVIPLLMKLHRRGTIVYDVEAVASEETPPTVRDEFRRRARIGAGGFQCLSRLWRLALPTAGWTSFTFLSHKVLRWFVPFFLGLALVANVMLVELPHYRVLLAAQLSFYFAALVGNVVPGNGTVSRLLRLATMFTSMNAALAWGCWGWLSGMQRSTWQRTAR